MQTRRVIQALALGLGLTLSLLAGLYMAHASPAAMVRYVTTDGNDGGGTNSCTSISTPCRTLQQAVNVATSGDEIRVATGIYTGVQARSGVTQVVYIDKTVTVRGGYTTTDWTTPYPLTCRPRWTRRRCGVVYHRYFAYTGWLYHRAWQRHRIACNVTQMLRLRRGIRLRRAPHRRQQ
jgi:hypothetical protein